MPLCKPVIILGILAQAFLGAFTARAEEARKEPSHNAWRELAPDARAALAPLLDAPADPTQIKTPRDDFGFAAWYHRYFCPNQPDTAWTACPAQAPSPESTYAEYRYNTLELGARIASACLTSQFRKDGVLEALTTIGQKATLTYGDSKSSVVLRVSNFDKLATDLTANGFTSDFCAGPAKRGKSLPRWCMEKSDDSAKTWGLRDSRSGPGLHWYQSAGLAAQSSVAVHIDYDNPGKFDYSSPISSYGRGIVHWLRDKRGWDKRTHSMLLGSQADHCGIGKTDQLLAIGLDLATISKQLAATTVSACP